jgi:hypothetical protein
VAIPPEPSGSGPSVGEESDTNPFDLIGPLVMAWLEVPEGSLFDGIPKLDVCCPGEEGIPKFVEGLSSTDWFDDTLAVLSDDPKGLVDVLNEDVELSIPNDGDGGGPLLKGEKSSFLPKGYGLEEEPGESATKGDELCLGVERNGDDVVADPNGGEACLGFDPNGDVVDLGAVVPKGE